MSQVKNSSVEIKEYEDDDDDIIRDFGFGPMKGTTSASYTTGNNEITEENEETVITSSSHKYGAWGLTPISEGGNNTIQSTSLFSIDINNLRSSGSSDANVVYVAVGKSESSYDALLWALDHALIPGTTLIYLVHIFSEIKFIPSPMGGGWVPKTQVSRELVEKYASQESSKRRELLTKYVDKCTTHLVQVETILIESDSISDAIVELISVLNIPKLILGISKSNLRKVKAGKWNGTIVADQVLQRAPPECLVKIICQGKDIMSSDQSPSPFTLNNKSMSPKAAASRSTSQGDEHQQHPPNINSFSCCFRPSPNSD